MQWTCSAYRPDVRPTQSAVNVCIMISPGVYLPGWVKDWDTTAVRICQRLMCWLPGGRKVNSLDCTCSCALKVSKSTVERWWNRYRYRRARSTQRGKRHANLWARYVSWRLYVMIWGGIMRHASHTSTILFVNIKDFHWCHRFYCRECIIA